MLSLLLLVMNNKRERQGAGVSAEGFIILVVDIVVGEVWSVWGDSDIGGRGPAKLS